MTRIVGGVLRGLRLRTPPGDATRPTAEKVRAALGNALAAAGALDDAVVLDLYAGSGALGLELLSRGAARAVFVERDRSALLVLRANLTAANGRGAIGTVVAVDARAYAASYASVGGSPGSGAATGLRDGPFDVVVADPPYVMPSADIADVLAGLHAAGALRPGAHLVLERDVRAGEFGWPTPLLGARSRRYGDTMLWYGRAP